MITDLFTVILGGMHAAVCRTHVVRFQLTEQKADTPVLMEINSVGKVLGLPFFCMSADSYSRSCVKP